MLITACEASPLVAVHAKGSSQVEVNPPVGCDRALRKWPRHMQLKSSGESERLAEFSSLVDEAMRERVGSCNVKCRPFSVTLPRTPPFLYSPLSMWLRSSNNETSLAPTHPIGIHCHSGAARAAGEPSWFCARCNYRVKVRSIYALRACVNKVCGVQV